MKDTTHHCSKCGFDLTDNRDASGASALRCPSCGEETIVPIERLLGTDPAVSADAASVDTSTLDIRGYADLVFFRSGGMGLVFLAKEQSLGQAVAVKILKPEFSPQAEFVKRFERECTAMAQLGQHPHVVRIHCQGRSGDLPYFVMEYVEGFDGGEPTTLRTLIQGKRIDLAKARELVLQVMDALQYAHEHEPQIIHRDVKPDNILVNSFGQAKLADFGIAAMRERQSTEHLTLAQTPMGTDHYMAPEQRANAASVDGRADIYSVGVILYEILTSSDYYAHEVLRPSELARTLTPPRQLDPAWDGVLLRACNPNRKSRFGTMREFAEEVRRLPLPDAALPESPAEEGFEKDYVKAKTNAMAAWNESLSSATRLEHAAVAAIASARVLQAVPDHEQALTLQREMRELGSQLAWNATKQAYQQRNLTAAMQLLEQVLEFAPGDAKATQFLDKLHTYRRGVMDQATQLAEQDRLRAGIDLLTRNLSQFPDDSQLISLKNRLEELGELLGKRRPILEKEQKWCEVEALVAQVEQSGIRIKGLEQCAKRARDHVTEVAPIVAKGRELLGQGDAAAALIVARHALKRVADHAPALELVVAAESHIAETKARTAKLQQALDDSAWFRAQRLLRSLQKKGIQPPEALITRTTDGVARSQAYLRFLGWVSVGLLIILLADGVSVVFTAGLEKALPLESWDRLVAVDGAGGAAALPRPVRGLSFGLFSAVLLAISVGVFTRKFPVGAVISWSILAVVAALCFSLFEPLPSWLAAVCTAEGSGEESVTRVANALAGWPGKFVSLAIVLSGGALWASVFSFADRRLIGGPAVNAPQPSAVAGVYAALLGYLVIAGPVEIPMPSAIPAALVLCGLLLTIGAATNASGLLILPVAGFLADVLQMGAVESGFAWYGKWDPVMTSILLMLATLLVSSWNAKLVPALSLAPASVFGVHLLNAWIDAPTLFILLPIWFLVAGSVAARHRDQLDFRLHLRDRIFGGID